MSSGQEKALLGSTLAALLPALRNKRTTVELRDESFVTGRVVQADGFMNIHMEEVTLTDPRGSRLKFESFFVQRRQIRYVQIPQSVNIKDALESVAGGRGRGVGRGRGRGEVSRHRAKILEGRELRRQEDLHNALKLKEEWRREKEEKERREKEGV